MQFDWQLFVSLLIVALAVSLVARTAWKRLRGAAGGCGTGCGKCHTGQSSQPLVVLDDSQESARPK